MSQNRVVLYSNGIADFQRVVKVTGNEPSDVSIPVSNLHVADVLASLNVYGDVRFDSTPTFRPTTELYNNISIDPHDSFNALATELSGSKVAIEKASGTVEGLLLGTHETQVATTGSPCSKKFLVISTDEGVKNIAYADIVSMQSQDEIVKAEIEKALKRNYESIKPNSTFVEFSIAVASEANKPEEVSEAIVQYAVPVAAWKISYRLIKTGDGDFLLRGFAIVDNNTEEDWNDVMISVVTGEPITFSTDLAEAKTPKRKHVNIVNESALGAIELEPEMVMMAAPALEEESYGRVEADRSRGRSRGAAMAKTAPRKVAKIDVAETREVSDFSVYDAKLPVSIGSNQSAMIPILDLQLGETKTVIHYDSSNHSERPFRCVEFVNSSAQSLSRGPCNVVIDETYVGSCIVPACKPTETSILPHVLETGVRVEKKLQPRKNRTTKIKISGGVFVETDQAQQRRVYRIKSVRPEVKQLILDHDSEGFVGSVMATITRPDHDPIELHEMTRIKSGYRVRFDLMPNDEVSVRFTETRMNSKTYKFGDLSDKFFFERLVRDYEALADDPTVIECIKLQERLDEKGQEISEQQAEVQRLSKRQERLRKNIGVGSNDDQSNQWRVDLARSEDRIVEIEEKVLPKLESERQAIKKELFEAAQSLVYDWEEE